MKQDCWASVDIFFLFVFVRNSDKNSVIFVYVDIPESP